MRSKKYRKYLVCLIMLSIFLTGCTVLNNLMDEVEEPVEDDTGEHIIDKSGIEYTGNTKSLKMEKYSISIPEMKGWSYIKSTESLYVQASYGNHTEDGIGELARYNIYYKPCYITPNEIINLDSFQDSFIYDGDSVYLCFEEQEHGVLCWDIYQKMSNGKLLWIQFYDDTAIEYNEGYIKDTKNLTTDEVLSLTLLTGI